MHIKKLGNCDLISVWREIIYMKGIVGGSVLGGEAGSHFEQGVLGGHRRCSEEI